MPNQFKSSNYLGLAEKAECIFHPLESPLTNGLAKSGEFSALPLWPDLIERQKIAYFNNNADNIMSDGYQLLMQCSNEADFLHAKLREIVLTTQHHRHLLDIGAATGIHTLELGQVFSQLTAIEPNHLLYSILRERLSFSLITNFVCHPYRLESIMPELNDKYDFILASHLFYYIPFTTWVSVINSLLNRLSPGGALIVILWSSQSELFQFANNESATKLNTSDDLMQLLSSCNIHFTSFRVSPTLYINSLRDLCLVRQFLSIGESLQSYSFDNNSFFESYNLPFNILNNQDIVVLRK
jgi:phospholipid N-methyltransferase